MLVKNTHKKAYRSMIVRRAVLLVSCAVASFIIGVKSANEYHPVGLTHADDLHMFGDFNDNGHLDVNDVDLALQISRGVLQPTELQLLKDPSGDMHITIDDALAIVRALQSQ